MYRTGHFGHWAAITITPSIVAWLAFLPGIDPAGTIRKKDEHCITQKGHSAQSDFSGISINTEFFLPFVDVYWGV
jgi:hypothetical protein